MVDIPTLNKSVLEFRSLIASNQRRTEAAEQKRLKAERDAAEKNQKELNNLNKKLKGLGPAQEKANLELRESKQKLEDLKTKLKENNEDIKNNVQVQKLQLEVQKKGIAQIHCYYH